MAFRLQILRDHLFLASRSFSFSVIHGISSSTQRNRWPLVLLCLQPSQTLISHLWSPFSDLFSSSPSPFLISSSRLVSHILSILKAFRDVIFNIFPSIGALLPLHLWSFGREFGLPLFEKIIWLALASYFLIIFPIKMNHMSERERSSQVAIEVDNLLTSMKMKLERKFSMPSECCIYRAPKQLRHAAEKSFIPKIISIGPFHHNREDLRDMEGHKMRYLKGFLLRTEVNLEDCIKLIKKQEVMIRSCYAESIDLNSDIFVELILVDAIFTIEMLLRISFPQPQNQTDFLLGSLRMVFDIAHDMLLLENQLPFFIMEDLLTLAKVSFPPDNDARVSMIKLTYNLFRNMLSQDIKYYMEKLKPSRIEHFLDFFMSCLLPHELPEKKRLRSLFIPNVKQLSHAGVRFKVGKHGILHVFRFEDGILEIPRLHLCDTTENLVRNLIAYEKCHFNDTYINNFSFVIDRLINTSEDVEILIQNQIVETNLPSSQAVASLINEFFVGATMVGEIFYFVDLFEDLNAYYRVPWHRWKATLKRDYFRTPWTLISVIAASLLLLLGFMQTIFTFNF